MLILTFSDYLIPAKRLAGRLDAEFAEVHSHHFPDHEILLRLPVKLPRHVIICRSLNDPNEKLIELLLCARTARELGAARVTLVAPYLCYMRQDIANHPGEAVSQRIIGGLLADLFDDVITVDPHLHRIAALEEAIPLENAISLSAGVEIGDYLQNKLQQALLLGPDSESEQWVADIAARTGFDFAIAGKLRHGDKQVEITLPEADYSSRPAVIIDDVASTGRTLARASELLLQAGARDIYVAVTHPLFCGDAEQHVMDAGVKAIWSTDSINHSTAVIPLDGLIARAVEAII